MKKLKRNVLNSSAMSKLFGGKEIPTSKVEQIVLDVK